MTDITSRAQLGRPRSGAMSSSMRYKRHVAKVQAGGGRLLHVSLSGELCALVAHIRRREGLRTDADALRVAIRRFAMPRSR